MRLLFHALAGFVVSTSAFASPNFTWKVTNSWNAGLEKKFSEFVGIMGESGCRTFTECLTSPSANPYYANRTPKVTYPSDCADLPFALRMYFAWMEGLPFDYVNSPVQADPAQETSRDIRYSRFGNKPGSFHTITVGADHDFQREYTLMRNSVSTATYRMHYNYVSDFYPMKIDRAHIVPGTVVYDPAGHAAIVFKIERDGRVRMMDAHPDNSVTRITYDQRFVRSRPAHGAGFRNWRPELSSIPTAQIPGYSTEQFQSSFQIGGEALSYYDYVRARLAGALKFSPVDEIKSMVGEICANIQDRITAVKRAVGSGIAAKPHPDKLPSNIYGTDGEWEEFSSPSRDARLKTSFVEMRKDAKRFLDMYGEGSSRIVYQPVESKYSADCAGDRVCMLAASLMTAYEEAVTSKPCGFTYTTSDQRAIRFGVSDVISRLYNMSFDPYHCPELRWGATEREELASCRDDRFKLQWFQAEQNLRNQIERTYDARMDFDVNGTRSLGVAATPPADVWELLASHLVSHRADGR